VVFFSVFDMIYLISLFFYNPLLHFLHSLLLLGDSPDAHFLLSGRAVIKDTNVF
jgi:hypothetical protein